MYNERIQTTSSGPTFANRSTAKLQYTSDAPNQGIKYRTTFVMTEFSSPIITDHASASPTTGEVFQTSPIKKPESIAIPAVGPAVKPGHRREYSSPSSVAGLGECVEASDYKALLLPPVQKLRAPIQHVRHVARQWRCVSPTDLRRADDPHSILKRNYIRRYLCERSESLLPEL
jgi:hypothetical protein